MRKIDREIWKIDPEMRETSWKSDGRKIVFKISARLCGAFPQGLFFPQKIKSQKKQNKYM